MSEGIGLADCWSVDQTVAKADPHTVNDCALPDGDRYFSDQTNLYGQQHSTD